MKASPFHALVVFFAICATVSQGRTSVRRDRQNEAWWQNTVIYQIYPRSYQDSDGDGTGDLKGDSSLRVEKTHIRTFITYFILIRNWIPHPIFCWTWCGDNLALSHLQEPHEGLWLWYLRFWRHWPHFWHHGGLQGSCCCTTRQW